MKLEVKIPYVIRNVIFIKFHYFTQLPKYMQHCDK